MKKIITSILLSTILATCTVMPAMGATEIVNPSTMTTKITPLEKSSIKITTKLSFKRNEKATLIMKGKPNTKYHIAVTYPSGLSEAKGLESKISNANGEVSWTWKVGNNTTEGEHTIAITGGGETVITDFTVD